jgi:predicted extracellular nuclease
MLLFEEGQEATIQGKTGTVLEILQSDTRQMVKLLVGERVYVFTFLKKPSEQAALDGLRLG